MARKLDECAPHWVPRVITEDRTVADIAAEIIGLDGWVAGNAPWPATSVSDLHEMRLQYWKQ